MNFGEALEALKQGKKVSREGWNGKGMWLSLVYPESVMMHGHEAMSCIGMKTADNKFQPGWLASQADMLADDWGVV